MNAKAGASPRSMRSVEAKVRQVERNRLWRAERPGWNRALNARYRVSNPEKYRAHKVVEYAVARGKLQRQPCQRCGATDLVHAHHDDYSKPLDVAWLCPLHHRERHRDLDAAQAAHAAE